MAKLGSSSVQGNLEVTQKISEQGKRVFSPNNRNISDSVSSTSSTVYASSSAVHQAYNLAASKMTQSTADSRYLAIGGKAKDSSALNGASDSTTGGANTIVKRDSNGDSTSRLFRSTYQNQQTMSGGLVYRVSESDNYLRICDQPSAVRNWLSTYSKGESDNTYARKDDVDDGVGVFRIDDISGSNKGAFKTAIVRLRDGRLAVRGEQGNDTTENSFGTGQERHINASAMSEIVPLPRLNWVNYGISGNIGYALSDTGDLWTWGGNARSGPGIPSPYWTSTPKLLRTGVAEFIPPKIIGYGTYETTFIFRLEGSNKYMCWGENNFSIGRQTGSVDWIYEPIEWSPPPGKAYEQCQEIHLVAGIYSWIIWIGNDGDHYAIGCNHHGQFGIGNTTNTTQWVELPWLKGKTVKKVLSGNGYNNDTANANNCWNVFVIDNDGWFAGYNGYGLGGALENVKTTYSTARLQWPGILDIHAIQGGAGTFYIRYSDGKWVSAGHSSEGQGGNLNELNFTDWDLGTSDDYEVFTSAPPSSYQYYTDTFFVKRLSDGTDELYTLGANRQGAGGVSFDENRPSAGGMLQVMHPFTSRIKDIAQFGIGGASTTQILLENGELWGAGHGDHYLLGGMFRGRLTQYDSNVFIRLF